VVDYYYSGYKSDCLLGVEGGIRKKEVKRW
jgi:hypothetical protein